MTTSLVEALWRQCVDPEFGPTEPLEGFEVLAAAQEPAGTNHIMYRTVRCRWDGSEWQDQEDRIIALSRGHSIKEPQEELDSSWTEFCEHVRLLNIERAHELRMLTLPPDRSPRGRLSGLARCLSSA